MARKDANPGRKEVLAQRRVKALQMRMQGLRYQSIADVLGCSVSQAYELVKHSMETFAEQEHELTNELRQLENDRLDAALRSIYQKAAQGDLKAIDRFLRISDQRCKLLGLYAPIKQE